MLSADGMRSHFVKIGRSDSWSCPVSSAPQSDTAAYSDKKSARAKVLYLFFFHYISTPFSVCDPPNTC